MNFLKTEDKHAILIQCHNKPEIVNFLIENLPSEHFDFYIHVDKKSDIFDKIVRKKNVIFSKRIDVRWGRVSQIEATLALFEDIKGKYLYVHLISGLDFLVKSPKEFIDFFKKAEGKQYIQSNPLPEKSTWSWGGMDRVCVYHPQFIIRRPTNKFWKFIRVGWREFVMRTKFLKRKRQPVNKFYGGSSWFSLTGECVQWIKEYLKAHPNYLRFFKNTVCGDEIFFSNIVRYSPFSDQIVNEPLRFMKWRNTTNGGPAEIKEEDFTHMINSIHVFARKFTSVQIIKKYLEFYNNEKNEKDCKKF